MDIHNATDTQRKTIRILYKDPNVITVDYNKKHFGSHMNTRGDEEILNIDRSEIENRMQEGPRSG